jgi:hypothetical protein
MRLPSALAVSVRIPLLGPAGRKSLRAPTKSRALGSAVQICTYARRVEEGIKDDPRARLKIDPLAWQWHGYILITSRTQPRRQRFASCLFPVNESYLSELASHRPK